MNKKYVLSFVLGVAAAAGLALLAVPRQVPDQKEVAPAPHQDMSAPNRQAMPADSIDVLAERLKARLEQQPNDVNGWVLLARSYHYLQRWDDAQAAFDKAKSLGYQGEPEPLGRDAQASGAAMQSGRAADPVFEDVARVAQQQAAQLQAVPSH